MNLTVNGKPMEFESLITGEELLRALNIAPAAVVVELNGDVIKRDEFLRRELADGDLLEIVTVVGGG